MDATNFPMPGTFQTEKPKDPKKVRSIFLECLLNAGQTFLITLTTNMAAKTISFPEVAKAFFPGRK